MIKVFIAPRRYTADNAAMVAGLGFYLYNKRKRSSHIGLEAEAN